MADLEDHLAFYHL